MKKIFLPRFASCVLAVAALCALAAAAPSQGDRSADVYYRDGARLALQGRLAEAASAFEHVVALEPSNGNAFYCLGNVYSEMGRWADAVNAYYRAVSLNKGDVEAYNGLGLALGMRGQHAQAAAAFEKAIKIYPKWGEPYYHLSEERRRLGQADGARAAYERAIKLEPDYAAHPPRRFTASAGASADTTSRGERAASAEPVAVGLPERIFSAPAPAAESSSAAAAVAPTPAETANDLDGDSTDAKVYFDAGVRKARAGRYDEATLNFRQSILMDRTNAEAYRELGDAYAALGRWRESVDAYEQAARLKPDDQKIYQGLGRSYARLREATPADPQADAASRNDLSATTHNQTAALPTATRVGADGDRAARADAPASGAKGEASRVNSPPRPERAENAPTARAAVASDDADPTAIYRVGPGDVLDVRVFDGRERRTTSYEVTPTGLLAYPSLAEPLNVAGLTTEQVAARLSDEVKRRDRVNADPQVAVGVREYASHTVIVSGMVKDAGTKILQREGVPLYAVVAYAQPLAGAGEAVVESRATGRTTAVDLSDEAAMKTLVRPGDVITLRERGERFFYVAGVVRQPGQKKFHVGLTLTQAVLAAGGTATPGAVVAVVSRQAADGRLVSTRYDLKEIGAGRAPDPPVKAGDRIEVLRYNGL